MVELRLLVQVINTNQDVSAAIKSVLTIKNETFSDAWSKILKGPMPVVDEELKSVLWLEYFNLPNDFDERPRKTTRF